MKKVLSGNSLSIGLALTMLLGSLLLNAREPELRPYRLINADFLNVSLINDEYVTKLNGNVHLFYGDTEFWADRAELFEVSKMVRMQGNVKVFEDTLSLFASEVEYFRLKEELYLTGEVFIKEEHSDGTIRTFKTDKGTYYRNEQRIRTYENSAFYDERESVSGLCNYLDYNFDSGYGYVTGQPEIYIGMEDSLSVQAERIEFYKDFNRIAASFNVRTFYRVKPAETAEEDAGVSEYRVTSDFLLIFTEEDYAVFLGEPVFTADDAEAKAERFYLYFEDEKIKSATLENNCEIIFAVTEGGEKTSKVEAKMIDLLFSEGKITGIKATGNVVSYYVGEQEKDKTINSAKSQRLEIGFDDDGEIETIVFRDRVSGMYRFSGRKGIGAK